MGHYQFIVALLFSSLASLFIFFRLFEAYFYSKPPEPTPSVIKEDRLFTLPMIGVSTGIVLLGVTFNYWFSVISTIIPVGLR
jgi:NADH:ubiquinone oxidoreductase subunit 5 (subunit L)/multisubunit Na+/H+ antiporter MnhA subunit